MLLSCFKELESGNAYCLVRPLQYMRVEAAIENEFNCPLLTLSGFVYCIPAKCVKRSVSVVHECSNTCTFVSSVASNRIEHEDIDVSAVVFKHDWSNNLYCFNIYCMC